MAITIDEFGRILIPEEVRDRLGIRKGVPLEIIIRDGELVIRPHDENLQKRVSEAMDYLIRNAPKPFVAQPEEVGEKWLSKKYSLRKIRLKES